MRYKDQAFCLFSMSSQKFGLGSVAPNFQAETTQGNIDFYNWKGDCWTVFFSFPGAFTPVCTTDLGAVAKLKQQWQSRNIKTIGLSCCTQDSHQSWLGDIKETQVNLYSLEM